MKTLLKLFAPIAASLAIATSLQAGAAIGKPAPEFELPGADGKVHSLSDHAGKTVVLEWVNHGCPFVRKHYDSGNMQNLQSNYTDEGVVWLTICSSAPGKQGHETAQGWQSEIADKGMKSSAVLMDESGKVGRMYGATATPHMYVIDPEGTLVYMGAIDSIPSTKQADIEKADSYVVAAIEAVKADEAVKKPVTKAYGCGVKYARDT